MIVQTLRSGFRQLPARLDCGADFFCQCPLCRYRASRPNSHDTGRARGNTERFQEQLFQLWQCPWCRTIRAVEPVDYADIYADYPLQKRRLDVFARGTLGNLVKRLRQAGLKAADRILDYGCGNGLLVQFLQEKGYAHVAGYDPYVPEFAEPPCPNTLFDCVIANDVIEHCDDPREFIEHCKARLRPGGLLYLGTSDAAGVEMGDLEAHLMRLHLPFHRTIFTEESLHSLVREAGLEIIRSWRRSYMDTWLPFANYRFLDELNGALGHVMDRAFDPAVSRLILRRPRLWFFALFGYFFPTAHEPAVACRK